ncbi:hypothetical protein Ani05nite_10040 [Amorphoplanes nipponensis]|uniref:GGDEF domain-containing protein n=1 Tax=Actinoplanes nipponensis TaxID=135950 RepID=A0A919JDP1_9ACTN|nr:hypothetical protein Ani05nite_10040 [Actinoplanes nipponensis]
MVDAALRRRRRAIEGGAMAARGVGIVSLTVYAAGVWHATASPERTSALTTCGLATALMILATALSVRNFRNPAARGFGRLSATQVALDTLVIIASALQLEGYQDTVAWPVLAVPILTAAVRHQLPGALTVWLVTSGSYVVAVTAGAVPARPAGVPFAVSVHLMIALISGTQATSYLRQFHDLQAARRALLERVRHDDLTGLLNRSGLEEEAARHGGRAMAVLLIDLNGFKSVNDTLGHAAGDQVLQEVAGRLSAELRPGDVAGRLGGDEFVVVLAGTGAREAGDVAARLADAVSRPVRIGDRTVQVGASIGASARPADSDRAFPALIAEADAAMYEHKAGHAITAGRRSPVTSSSAPP